jgi:hypothetical protein
MARKQTKEKVWGQLRLSGIIVCPPSRQEGAATLSERGESIVRKIRGGADDVSTHLNAKTCKEDIVRLFWCGWRFVSSCSCRLGHTDQSCSNYLHDSRNHISGDEDWTSTAILAPFRLSMVIFPPTPEVSCGQDDGGAVTEARFRVLSG